MGIEKPVRETTIMFGFLPVWSRRLHVGTRVALDYRNVEIGSPVVINGHKERQIFNLPAQTVSVESQNRRPAVRYKRAGHEDVEVFVGREAIKAANIRGKTKLGRDVRIG